MIDQQQSAPRRIGHCATCQKGRMLPDGQLCAECIGYLERKAAQAERDNAASMAATNGTALRASRMPPYHLVPIELLHAVAASRLRGDVTYAPGNWMHGDRLFFIDCINHTIEHLYRAVDCSDPEDIEVHFGNAATNIAFMLWALARGIIRRGEFMDFATIWQEAANGNGTNVNS